MVLAGGRGLKLGQHLEVNHQSHTRVVQAVANGLKPGGIGKLGDYDSGLGPLAGLVR